MEEDQILQSIIADPQLTDPSIDVGQLRQTTPTRTELLADVPEFSGLKYDFTNRDYIRDLYSIYGGGLPTIPEPVVEDTAQIPGAVDTLVNVGGGGGMDQVTGGLDTPTVTESVGGGADMGTVPATGQIGDGSITVENIAQDQTPYDIPMDLSDPGASIENIIAKQNLETIQEPPPISPVTTSINRTTGEVFDAQTGEEIGNLYDEVALAGTPEQKEGFLQNVLGRAGQTVGNALSELGKVPGAVVDFANQTVDIFGQKLNVGKTLTSAAINKLAGGPISLVFEAIGALASQLPSEDPANTLKRNIVDELKASGKNYGFNMQSGTLNQDPFGRNPVSVFGNYEQTLLDDATSTSTTKMALAKKEFAQDYFDKKASKIAPQENIGSVPGDVTTNVDPVTGDLPGGGNIVDEFDTTNEAAVNVGTPSFEGFDSGGFDPAPAPAPAPSIPDRGRGDRDGGGGNGGGGSPGSQGPGGSDAMGSF